MWTYAPYLVDTIWNLCTVFTEQQRWRRWLIHWGVWDQIQMSSSTYSLTFFVYAFRWCDCDFVYITQYVVWFIDRLKCFDWIEGSWRLKKLLQQKCAIYRIEIVYSIVKPLNYVLRVLHRMYISVQINSNEFCNLKLFIVVRDWFFMIMCYLLFRRSNASLHRHTIKYCQLPFKMKSVNRGAKI